MPTAPSALTLAVSLALRKCLSEWHAGNLNAKARQSEAVNENYAPFFFLSFHFSLPLLLAPVIGQ